MYFFVDFTILSTRFKRQKLKVDKTVSQKKVDKTGSPFPTNRYFRFGRVIRLLAIQGEFTSTHSPVAKQLCMKFSSLICTLPQP